jgi:hypothetical protein
MADAHKNFAYSTVATAPSPATSGTSLVVAAGQGSRFPAVPFNATIWPINAQPTSTNAEIVRVTNISTDTFTITRTQESTSARTVVVGDQIAADVTAKTLTDIESGVPAAATLLSFQNRQIVASTITNPGQNSIWLTPFQVPPGNYVSASSFVLVESLTGTFTSNVAATWGQTIQWALYSNNTTNSSRFDTWLSSSITAQVYNSSTNSISYDWDGTNVGSNNSNLASRFTSIRIIPENINTLVPPGAYLFGYAVSTSTAGYNSMITSFGFLMDRPVSVTMGEIGANTDASVGYGDAGTYSVTSAAMPTSIGLSEIIQSVNIIPYIKMGAI